MEREKVLLDRESICAVYCGDLDGISSINEGSSLHIDDVLDGKGDLDTVSVIMTAENDPLQLFDPFFRAADAIGFEVVRAVLSRDGE